MIDENVLIKRMKNRIDEFVQKYPERADGLEVETIKQFIDMLQIEGYYGQVTAREMIAKEYNKTEEELGELLYHMWGK